MMVMATGTGKTRTTVALIDLFFRANQARKILFLADRDALVDQALKDGFHTFLPNEASDRIYTHNIDKTKRLYVATLQTISRCYEQFSPGFFDLLVFDEAHRSIFNRMNEVMEYFDARMIGLTRHLPGSSTAIRFAFSIVTAKRRQHSIPMPKQCRRDTLSISAARWHQRR